MSHLSDEDKFLFLDAIKDVAPLQTQPQVKHSQKKISAHQAIKKTAPQTQNNELSLSFEALLVPKVSAFESLNFCRPGVRVQEMTQLKKGNFDKTWQLDLHGLTEDMAEIRLAQFLHTAKAHKARYLLIVHGKGYHSDLTLPIIKNLVNQTLRQVPNVLAFCSAQQKDGGTGAVYVFLKG